MIGQVIGQYRILEKIGQGGMGEVYKAVDVNLDRVVAIKMLSKDLTQDETLIQRFRSEAKTQAQLNHPNICTLYSLLKHQDNLFMVMEFVEGQTFEQLIKSRGPLPFQEIVPLFQQALFGLSRAHRMGIIHRDIKPANVIVNREGVVKVMDFGIARVVGESRLTRTGLAVGTLFYMPPEQIQGKEVDYRADIYALGLTIYELLTGTLPFRATTEFEIMQAHVKEIPKPPSKVYPYLPKVFDKVVLRALEKDPARRYQTVEEFSQALGQAMQEAMRAAPQTTLGQTVATPTAAPLGQTVAQTTMAPVVMPSPGWLGLTKKQLLMIGGSVFGVIAIGLIIILGLVLFSGKKDLPSSGSTLADASSVTSTTTSGTPSTPAPRDVVGPSKSKVDLGGKNIPGLETKKSEPEPPSSTRTQPKESRPSSKPAGEKQVETPSPPKKEESDPWAEEQGKSADPGGAIVLPGGGGSPSDPATEQVRELERRAQAAFNQGNYAFPQNDCAFYYVAEILKRDPGNATAANLFQQMVPLLESQMNTLVSRGDYAGARNLVGAVLTYFPNDPDLREAYNSLQGMEEQAAQTEEAETFLVSHDHTGSFMGFCVGYLHIYPDRLVFQVIQTNDGQQHGFDVSRGQIKEFETNVWPIGGYSCFHIKLRDGRNFNFAYIDQNGTNMDPSIVVAAYEDAGE
ncbi:MAG: protein kinase [Acidobacteria bacterium]|nr:protein kinase [Acidobacteriota bacterium]